MLTRDRRTAVEGAASVFPSKSLSNKPTGVPAGVVAGVVAVNSYVTAKNQI